MTRADFLQALRRLDSARTQCPDHFRLMRPVYVNCSYDAWTAAMGEPEEVRQYRVGSMHGAIGVWKHHCADGPVTCIGHVFERSGARPWVIVMRVGLC
jgi:hypothetical protein